MSQFITNIKNSGLSIYDSVVGTNLWIPDLILQKILQEALFGINLHGMPPRTRSKFVKEKICTSLGYPIPKSFKKTQPRFTGQNFDVYIQKSNNLQIWNEEISAERRYIIVQVVDDKISKVKVINGATLSQYDKTGTLTIKHQATFIPGKHSLELLSSDTGNIKKILLSTPSALKKEDSPINFPHKDTLFSIERIFEKLSPIVGMRFKDSGFDQDRNRGAELHKLVCKQLGYSNYKDNGQFPDVLHQITEVKLQTAPTIDLGKICPDSQFPLSFDIDKNHVRHCDVRYALFYGIILNGEIEITHFSLVVGANFFLRFPQFKGNTINKKIQLPLPKNFFSS